MLHGRDALGVYGRELAGRSGAHADPQPPRVTPDLVEVRTHRFTRDVVAWWQTGYDLLLTPTTAEPAPFLGDLLSTTDDPMRPLTRALPFAVFTVPANVTGQPAMSVPLYWTADDVPVGVQLVADQYREDVLVRVAAQLEAAQPWSTRRPRVSA